MQHSRRDFLKATGVTLGAAAGVGILDAAQAAGAETLAGYRNPDHEHFGQQVRIMAYGGHIVRV